MIFKLRLRTNNNDNSPTDRRRAGWCSLPA